MNDGGVEFPSSETESEDDLDSVSVVARTRDRLSGTGSTQSEDSSTHSGESSIHSHSHSTVSQDSGISETEDSRTRTKPSRPIRKIEPSKRKNCSILIPFLFFARSFVYSINCFFLLLEQSQSMSVGWVFKNLFKFALKIMKSYVPYNCLILSVAKLKF